MSCKSESGIIVEKTLHMENAFVTSMHYASLSKPILTETITVEGKDLVRVSKDNGKTWMSK